MPFWRSVHRAKVPFWWSVYRAKVPFSDGTLPFWKLGQNTAMTWLNLMQSIHVIDMMVVKDDGESNQFIQIVIGDFYLVRFDGKKYVWFCGTSSWLWCHTWSPTNEISEVPSLDDKEKYTKQVQRRKIDVWCHYWVKLTSRILRKLPHPNIGKKKNYVHFMFPMDAE